MESKGGSYLQGTGAWLWHSQQSPEPRDRRRLQASSGMPPLGAASRVPADLGCFLGPPPRPPPRPTCCFLILLMCLPLPWAGAVAVFPVSLGTTLLDTQRDKDGPPVQGAGWEPGPAEGRSPWRFGGGVPGASASLAGAPRDPSRVVCRREGSWLEAGIHTHVLQGGEGFLKERFHQHLLGSRLISEPTAQESWHCDPQELVPRVHQP